jgi:hypothetical protein
MRDVPAPLAAAIDAGSRRPRLRLEVDFDGDGYGPAGSVDDLTGMATSYRLDRALDGELPDQVRVVAGSAAAAGTVGLAGSRDGRSASWHLSPLNPASPLAGKRRVGAPARLAIGMDTTEGTQWVPRLTGRTRTVRVQSGDRDAHLSLLDERERLRTMIALPPIDGARYGANASWPITWALAASGWTPAPRPRGMRLAADGTWQSDAAAVLPMHGSLWPWFRTLTAGGAAPDVGAYTRGQNGPETPIRPTFVAGPHVLGAFAEAATSDRYTQIRATLLPRPGALPMFTPGGAGGRVELWLRGDPAAATSTVTGTLMYAYFGSNPGWSVFCRIGLDRRMTVRLANGNTTVFDVNGPTLPADGQWHFCGFDVRLKPTPQVLFRLDDTASTSTPTVTGTPAVTDRVQFSTLLPVADLHITGTGVLDPWLPQQTIRDAFVDPSTLDLDAVAVTDDREAWSLLREIGAAEQATVGCDEDGTLRYRTRSRLMEPAAQTVQLTLTAENAITDIAVQESADTVRTVVDVPYTPVGFVWDTVWQPAAPIPVGRDTVTVPVTFDGAVSELDATTDLVTTAPNGAAVSYAVVNTRPDGSGTTITDASLVSVSVQNATAGRAELRVRNGHWETVWLTTVRLAGRVARLQSAGTARASAVPAGRQPLPLQLPASPWVQRADVAAFLAEQILYDLNEPRPTITDLAIRGDPRLQLGDRVRLVDRDGLGIDAEWWITGITDQLTPEAGFTMRVTARQALTVATFDGPEGFNNVMWGA